jgi:hypothetical protein
MEVYMNEKIKNHIDKLFESAPKTRKGLELKEELLANSEERYQDLITDGVAPEDAIKNVINSIGNVAELFQGLEEITSEDRVELVAYVKKAAVIKTVAVGIYIFSIVILFVSIFLDNLVNRPDYFTVIPGYQNHFDFIMLGVILMILIDIIPTCMLVYTFSLAPQYKKQGDTVVEDFKEWKNHSEHSKSIKSATSGVLWTGALLLYFVLSIATRAWYATWIVFLVAVCIQTIIILVYRLKETA